MQALLNHTSKRLLQSLPLPLQNISTLHCKWGFDGTSGFTKYKQLIAGTSEDDSIFVTSLVPLRLVDNITNQIVWQNPASSSTRYCRPIRLQYVKETVNISQNEEKYITEQINRISNFECEFGIVNFNMEFTMVDGKVNHKYSTFNMIKNVRYYMYLYINRCAMQLLNRHPCHVMYVALKYRK